MELKTKKNNISVFIDDCDAHLCRAMQIGRDGMVYVRWWQNGKQIRKSLSRLIMQAPTGLQVDHINKNRMDNRRCNLRLATPSQNTCNRRRPQKTLSSPFQGVAFFNRKNLKNKWHARLKLNGKSKSIGYFKTAEQAAFARDIAAIRSHGEFANLNFPCLASRRPEAF